MNRRDPITSPALLVIDAYPPARRPVRDGTWA